MKKGGSIPFRPPAQNVVPFLECGRRFQDAMEHQKQSFLSLHGSIPLTTKLQGLHNNGSNNWCRRELFGCRNVGSSIKYRNKSRIKNSTQQYFQCNMTNATTESLPPPLVQGNQSAEGPSNPPRHPQCTEAHQNRAKEVDRTVTKMHCQNKIEEHLLSGNSTTGF